MVFVLIGFRRVSILWIAVWLITLALVGATNRGPSLAVVVPVTIALLALGRYRLLFGTLATTVAVFSVLLVIESATGQYEEAKDSLDRPVSVRSP